MATPFERRTFTGGAPDTALAASISPTDLLVTVLDATGYPAGPGYLVLDQGTSTEEKSRYSTRSGNAFTIASVADRGVDGTLPFAHTGGSCTVRQCFTATDADEANNAVHQTLGQASAGALLLGTGPGVLTPTIPNGAGTDDNKALVVDHTVASRFKLAAVSLPGHVHAEADVTGLVAALSGSNGLLYVGGTNVVYSLGAGYAPVLDGALLSPSFIFPSSGRILARLTCEIVLDNGFISPVLWTFVNHGLQSGVGMYATLTLTAVAVGAIGNPEWSVSSAQLVNGTPGSSAHWDLAIACGVNGTQVKARNVTVEIWGA